MNDDLPEIYGTKSAQMRESMHRWTEYLGLNQARQGYCVTCDNEVHEFRDELSRIEYGISGMCQECQDKVFVE
jgi:RNA polymerase-binding transcription factor DksA